MASDDRLNDFLSINLPRFYGLPYPKGKHHHMRLWRDHESDIIPDIIGDAVPFRHGEQPRWKSELIP